jgi:DNA-binding MarR family transcriptional regulator
MKTKSAQAIQRTVEEGNFTPVGPLDNLIGYHLRRASAAFSADFGRAMTGTGMRQVLIGILSIVNTRSGVNQGAVGRALGIHRANMVTLVNELTDRGLIAKQVSGNDRRALELSITPAGRTMLQECLERIAAHEENMLGGLSGSDRATLIELLGRIEAQEA